MFSVGGVFIANIALARALPAPAYGQFAITYSLFTFLAGVHNGLLLEAFTVYGSGRYRTSFDGYWRIALRANLALCLLLAFLVASCSLAFAEFTGSQPVQIYLVLAVVLPVLLSSLFLRRILYVERRSVQVACMASVFFVSVVSLVIAANYWRVLTGSTVLVILAFSWLAASPVFLWRRAVVSSRANFTSENPGYLAHHWQYSKWAILNSLAFQLTQQAYFWLAAILLDNTRVAELRAAWNIIQPATLIFSSLSFVMLPRLASLIETAGPRRPSMRPEMSKYIIAVLIVSLGGAALTWGFGRLAYSFIYAGKFDDSVPVLYVIALMPVAVGISGVFSDALRAIEKPGLVFYAYVAAGLITLAGGIPAILSYGIQGAAWSMVASNAGYAIALMVCYWLVRKPRHC